MSLPYCPECGKDSEQDGYHHVICPEHGRVMLPPFDDMGPTDEMSSKLQAATECAEAAARYIMSERFISDELALKAAVEKWQKS